MKKMYILAGAFVLATVGSAAAQGTELFFSEYNEGSHMNGSTCPGQTTASTGNEKTMEVYNPTTSTVPLDQYSIRRYSNGMGLSEDERIVRGAGTTTSGGVAPPAGPNTLSSGATFVMAHPDVSISDIRSAANQYASPRATTTSTVLVGGGPIQFNGDDAMALVRWTGATAGTGTAVIVDIFGIIGNRPNPPGMGTQGMWVGTDRNGGDTRSANQSLVRSPAISSGSATLVWDINTNPGLDPATFNIGAEWETYSNAFSPDACAQSYSDLGQHTYTGPNGAYSTVGLLEEFNNAIQFYPNPANGRVNVSLGTAKVGLLTVVNSLGRTIFVRPSTEATTTTLDVSSLTPGLYFVRCTSADGKLTVYKELVVQ